jgi:hypothetical protein
LHHLTLISEEKNFNKQRNEIKFGRFKKIVKPWLFYYLSRFLAVCVSYTTGVGCVVSLRARTLISFFVSISIKPTISLRSFQIFLLPFLCACVSFDWTLIDQKSHSVALAAKMCRFPYKKWNCNQKIKRNPTTSKIKQ